MATKKAQLQAVEAENENENEELDIDKDIIKETKFDNLLNTYKSQGEDYTATLYRKNPTGKGREFILTYDSEIPTQQEIRDKFGPGKYRLMIHDTDGRFIDNADVNLANIQPTNKTDQPAAAPAPSRMELLNELKAMSEIVGGKSDNKNDQTIILKLADMQQKQFESMTRFQIESNQKMTDLIMSMQSKKPALSEILEVVEFVDGLKGGGGPAAGASTIENLISNPMIQAIIPQILAKIGNSNPAPAPAQIGPAPMQQIINNTKPAASLPLPKMSVEELKNSLPDDLIQKITKENHLKIIEVIFENNKNDVEKSTVETVINEILMNKGNT